MKKPNALLTSIKSLRIIDIIMLIIAGIINATGVILLLTPAGIIDGGLSGTSVFLSQVTSLHVSIFLLILNIPFFIVGFKKLGYTFIIYSLIAIGSYSLMSYIYTTVTGLDQIVQKALGADMILCTIFGGLISGVGSGLTIRFGGAIDGVEVMAVLFAKKVGLTVGQFVMAYNLVIYLIASIVMDKYSVGLYSVLAYVVGLKAVDFVVEGFDMGKQCMIITDKYEELAQLLSAKLGRGITLLDSQGYYSGDAKKLMYIVVNRFEIVGIKKLIYSVDPQAFVTISDVSEVMGTNIRYRTVLQKSKNKNKNK